MQEQNSSLTKDIIDMLIYVSVLVAVILLIHTFVGEQVKVRGTSMENTLLDEDRLFLEKISYNLDKPKRFDIVVFHPKNTSDKTYYIKRIIGLPGETIQIVDSKIYINNVLLEENFGKEDMIDPGIAGQGILLSEDEYFVLGDNRNNSTDSRFPSVGAVTLDSIQGKAWLRILPISQFGILEHQK